jgi:uncharacterized phage protein (TIGR02216 family)
MQLGLGMLRLAPQDFWAMTPRELEAALSVGQAPRPMGRPDLERLMQLFPDEK